MKPSALGRRAQMLAGVTCGAFFATMTTSVSVWKAAGWEGWRIGVAVAGVTLGYAVFVALGGRAADRWGSRWTGVAGALLGLCGSLAAAMDPAPGTALMTALAVNAAGALCFPAIARWIAMARDDLPLHAKVARYNLGWATGELAGFAVFALLADAPRRTGFLIVAVLYVVLAAGFWTVRTRGGHARGPVVRRDPVPAGMLDRLALNGRLGLLLACAIGGSLLSQSEKALSLVAGEVEARRLAGVILASFATGMLGAFLTASKWTGWILKPKIMLACQGAMPLGAIGLIFVSPEPATLRLAVCGGLVGLGFGAAYTSSLYYSLRLPVGSGRAAGIHETFIGIGNTIGPIICGMILDARIGGGGLASVGTCALLIAGVSTLVQLGLTNGISLSEPVRRKIAA